MNTLKTIWRKPGNNDPRIGIDGGGVCRRAVAAMLYLSGMEVSSGAVKVGSVMAAITYAEQILLSMMIAGRLFHSIAQENASAERVCALLTERPEIADGTGAMLISMGILSEITI